MLPRSPGFAQLDARRRSARVWRHQCAQLGSGRVRALQRGRCALPRPPCAPHAARPRPPVPRALASAPEPCPACTDVQLLERSAAGFLFLTPSERMADSLHAAEHFGMSRGAIEVCSRAARRTSSRPRPRHCPDPQNTGTRLACPFEPAAMRYTPRYAPRYAPGCMCVTHVLRYASRYALTTRFVTPASAAHGWRDRERCERRGSGSVGGRPSHGGLALREVPFALRARCAARRYARVVRRRYACVACPRYARILRPLRTALQPRPWVSRHMHVTRAHYERTRCV